jgi:hypothetical protein
MTIPYGAITTVVGAVGVAVGAGQVAVATLAAGAVVSACSVISLRTWKSGGHSTPFTLLVTGARMLLNAPRSCRAHSGILCSNHNRTECTAVEQSPGWSSKHADLRNPCIELCSCGLHALQCPCWWKSPKESSVGGRARSFGAVHRVGGTNDTLTTRSWKCTSPQRNRMFVPVRRQPVQPARLMPQHALGRTNYGRCISSLSHSTRWFI